MIAASNWQPRQSGALRGHVDLELSSGLILLGCGLFEQDGKRWIAFPTRVMVDRNGQVLLSPKTSKPAYSATVTIRDKALLNNFKAQALAAVDELLGRRGAAPGGAP